MSVMSESSPQDASQAQTASSRHLGRQLVPKILGHRGRQPAWVLLRLGWLLAVLYGVAQRVSGQPRDAQLAAVGLALSAAAGWCGWIVVGPDRHPRSALVSLAAVGGFGGAVAAFTPIGLVFPALAGLGAGLTFDTPVALAIALVGPLAGTVAIGVADGSGIVIACGFATALAGFVVGAARREEQKRTRQITLLAVEQQRAATQEARAEMLAERNRLAREVHDVLAHTLGAVSIQLEALDGFLSETDADARTLETVHKIRRLVVGGLAETREAVRALRGKPVSLADQFKVLASHHEAELNIVGTPRPLSPEFSLALYRAAQEALTNAAKHAPGTLARVTVEFGAGDVTLIVANDCTVTPSPLSASGGGYGLQGLRERVHLVGGRCQAGPDGDGWAVRVEVAA
jgi:signal transduction histidine kinase